VNRSIFQENYAKSYLKQSPANSRSPSHEIPRLLWRSKFHYRVHNSQPLVPIPREMNPVHPPHILFI